MNLVPFAGKANDVCYSNKRAEMYFNLGKAIRNGLYISDKDLKEELLNTRFLLDKSDRYLLVPKEEIKLILNRSPDTADALALTYTSEDTANSYVVNKRRTQRYARSILGNVDD